MAKSNFPTEVKAAISKAGSVETSQKGHHTAMMAMISVANTLPSEEVMPYLSLYTANRHEKAKDTLCTVATNKWLEVHFGIHVKDGVAGKGREFEAKGIDEVTHAKAKAYPWYAMAKDMAFKLPTPINLKAAATMQLRLEITGEKPLTDKQVLEAWKLARKEVEGSTKLLEWEAAYKAKVEAGEIEAKKAA